MTRHAAGMLGVVVGVSFLSMLTTGCDGRSEPEGQHTHAQTVSEAVLVARAEELTGTIVTPHLEQPLPEDKNVLWCSTFQLAWNEMCDLRGGDIRMKDEPAMVAVLNKRAATKADLDEACYVALAGRVGNGIVQKIESALSEKFRGAASPELAPQEGEYGPDFLIAYAYLFKHLPFRYALLRHEFAHRFAGQPVASFGLKPHKVSPRDERRMARQVLVIDYRSDDGFTSEDFIIELETTSPEDRLILAMVPAKATLAETVGVVGERVAAAEPRRLAGAREVVIPVLDFDILREYSELYGRPTLDPDGKPTGMPIVLALQTIRFRLDETGAVLKSEAVMIEGLEARYIFNKPFLVLLQRRGAEQPYFALWVANAELLMPFK